MSTWKEYLNTGYFVSSCGMVKNRSGRILKGQCNRGYRMVTIEIDGEYKNIGVHRLVATCFINNPESKPHVNHIDAVRNNNDVSNLEWCTPKENIDHAVLKMGTIGKKFKEAALYSDEQILNVANLLKLKLKTTKEISE
jgi:hypothetical protein